MKSIGVHGIQYLMHLGAQQGGPIKPKAWQSINYSQTKGATGKTTHQEQASPERYPEQALNRDTGFLIGRRTGGTLQNNAREQCSAQHRALEEPGLALTRCALIGLDMCRHRLFCGFTTTTPKAGAFQLYGGIKDREVYNTCQAGRVCQHPSCRHPLPSGRTAGGTGCNYPVYE
ncbi:hypothetical protein NDU88_000946 [Pleurodeles waltl]|uniref:Uncharacterized protein n=1 Tax=Pleurodeles waltl TaxID=8319 RepID=A0AAV7KPN0_PLEWA|nr:hypothetical protein NDU88_000946 [Pleurodeles waltl]